MTARKPLTLGEARKRGKLKQFTKEHPAEGDQERFDLVFRGMAAGKPPSKAETSKRETSED
jgi:hypothetical protein